MGVNDAAGIEWADVGLAALQAAAPAIAWAARRLAVPQGPAVWTGPIRQVPQLYRPRLRLIMAGSAWLQGSKVARWNRTKRELEELRALPRTCHLAMWSYVTPATFEAGVRDVIRHARAARARSVMLDLESEWQNGVPLATRLEWARRLAEANGVLLATTTHGNAYAKGYDPAIVRECHWTSPQIYGLGAPRVTEAYAAEAVKWAASGGAAVLPSVLSRPKDNARTVGDMNTVRAESSRGVAVWIARSLTRTGWEALLPPDNVT